MRGATLVGPTNGASATIKWSFVDSFAAMARLTVTSGVGSGRVAKSIVVKATTPDD